MYVNDASITLWSVVESHMQINQNRKIKGCVLFLETRKKISLLYHETRTGIKQMLGLMQSVFPLTVSVD